MQRDARLEEISDQIRAGQPVDFWDAIEAINYQEALRQEERSHSPLVRFWRRLRAALSGGGGA